MERYLKGNKTYLKKSPYTYLDLMKWEFIFFPVDGNYSILDCLLLEWKDIKKFEVKKGLLLENTMNIVTNEMNVSLKINKTVAGNSGVKENIKKLLNDL